MPDPYQELDVFGRPKSRVDGVPYVAFDDDLAALQNYVLNLKAKEEAIESGARTPRRVKEIVREGGRLPGYVHPYEPGYVVQEQERLRDETDPVQFLPIVRQGVENVRAIVNEGFDRPEYIDAKLFGQRAPQYLNTLSSQVRKGGPGFEARFGEWQDPWVIGGDPALQGSLAGRTQMWPEKMARSGATLAGDVMSGKVMTGPGLRATDFSDIPGAPNPLAPLIERTQDLAGMAMGGSIPELAARGADRNVLGSGFVPKITKELPPRAANSNAAIPGPVPFPERLYTNYARVIKPEDVLTSEPVWSGAERLSNETGMGYSEAFAQIANEFWRRQGANKYITPELAQAYIKRARSGLTLAADDEVGGAVGASKNALKDLTQGSFGGNVSPSVARNIGRETMPEILARQRASEGYEAAIRDPETKKLYTGMWHEEVLDKIAKDKGVPKDQLPTNLVKGYVNDRGRFLTEEAVERMSQNRSKTAMFRADDEVGAAVAAMHAAEGKAPELKVGQANLPAVIPQGGLPAPGTALNPISNRRGFLRGARDLMAAASNANKIVGMAEKLGQTPVPKNPKVPLKEIWKTGEGDFAESSYNWARDQAYENRSLTKRFHDLNPGFRKTEKNYYDYNSTTPEERARYDAAKEAFEASDPKWNKFINRLLEEHSERDEGGTQFSHRQLPGATNYREHLMQMPEQPTKLSRFNDALSKKYGGDFSGKMSDAEKIEMRRLVKEAAAEGPPKSFYGDWDEPDIIGHSRVNDRQIPGVGKALHIEEIGSQLHEKGAKEGYGKVDTSKWTVKDEGDNQIVKNQDGVTRGIFGKELSVKDAIAKAAERDVPVPDVPFKKTYVDLAVNRMLHEAATEGYDAVSWTPHEIAGRAYNEGGTKEAHARVEALAKKYGGKIEKKPIDDVLSIDKRGEGIKGDESTKGNFYNVFVKGDGGSGGDLVKRFDTLKEAEDFVKENSYANVLKLTPEMKRIFGHEDFSFFPLRAAQDKWIMAGNDLRKKYGDKWESKATAGEIENYNQLESNMKKAESGGFKLRSDSEAGAAIGALRNSVAPTFYSGLGRTIERAPFETATPSQWMKHLRDTVGARQAEEFEHVGLEGRLGPLAEVKAPVERKAQAALETWKAANKGQRPPKELTDAASNENKRIVEQRLVEKDKEKSLTKAELLAHVAGNQPKFKEIVKGHSADDMEAAIQRRAQEIVDDDMHNITTDEQYQDRFYEAQDQAAKEFEGGATKYSDYQLPGGTNYREHLMTMPKKDRVSVAKKYEELQRTADRRTLTEAEHEEMTALERAMQGRNHPQQDEHYSSHWDEPNVIVHTRMNDRDLLGDARLPSQRYTNIGRSLHAEEFQSDLHQEGRKKGYKDPNARRKYEEALQEANKHPPHSKEYEEGYAKASKLANALNDSSIVPNFPFKKSWPDLAIKRWLREAADNDYDAVSWTPGEAQRDRFQLGHTLESLYYDQLPDGKFALFGETKDGRQIKINRGLPVKENELSQHVGEAVAEKIKKDEGKLGDVGDYKRFSNADLRVGGEGLVSFYDKTVKGKVEALVEKFGGKVEKHKIKGDHDASNNQPFENRGYAEDILKRGGEIYAVDKHGREHLMSSLDELKNSDLGPFRSYILGDRQPDQFVWSVKLTPEMKRAIRSEGFPLFTAGPVMTPVDHDPFDKKQKPKPKLEPVEHDPFAQPTPDLGGTLNKLISTTGGYRPRPRPIQNGFGRRQ